METFGIGDTGEEVKYPFNIVTGAWINRYLDWDKGLEIGEFTIIT